MWAMILIAPSSSTIFPRSSNNKAVRQPHPFGARGSTVCRVVDSKLPSRTVSALEGQMSSYLTVTVSRSSLYGAENG